MIPYRDENPTHRVPVVTYALIVANLIAWAILQGFGTEPALSESVCRFGAIPAGFTGADTGNLTGAVCPPGPSPWLTALTSMFMHAGWFHLLGNMWFLWLFADNVEDAIGPGEFVLFYLLGGVAAVAVQVLSEPGSLIPMVGASGAIGGVMGAYARLYPRVRVHLALVLGFFVLRRTLSAFAMLGIWLGLQLLGAVAALFSQGGGGVAFWAHIGGFVAGYVLIPLFHRPRPYTAREV